jgi:hypothetical protein
VGPIPPLVITKSCCCTMRLLASILRRRLGCYISKWKRWGVQTYISSSSSGITSIRFLPCPPVPTKEEGAQRYQRTIQYHSRSNSVRSSLNYGPAFSHSESRHFLQVRNYTRDKVGGLPLLKETHPIMSAPAVLIHRPSPNGFDGRGDISKCIPDEEDALAAVVSTFGAAVEEFAVVVMVRKVGECRERTNSR